ncbi:AMP-binding protein [Pseudonocardia sp. T1-2H]|uniref:AMP-binding protein n=1 Tax=Pseudonocardia sp. T1-2H TaxID=3128899 RepID=UPI003100B705
MILGEVPGELSARAHGAARVLAARGVRQGSRVAVDGGDVLAWLLGADLLGAATLVVEPRWTARERAAIVADALPDVVVDGDPAPGLPVPPGGTSAPRSTCPRPRVAAAGPRCWCARGSPGGAASRRWARCPARCWSRAR